VHGHCKVGRRCGRRGLGQDGHQYQRLERMEKQAFFSAAMTDETKPLKTPVRASQRGKVTSRSMRRK